MSSLHHLSRRDLEALSAYLDGELRPAEARRLEARLHKEAQLRMALAELRSLREAVRALPVARPPRSLALTPEMVGRRSGARPYPALQLATALATAAFLVVSGANAILGRSFTLGARAPAEVPMMLEAAPPAAEITEAAPFVAPAPFSDALVPSTTPEMLQRAVAPETGVLGGGIAETPAAPSQIAEALPSAEPLPTGVPGAGGAEGGVKQAPAIPLRALEWLQLGLGALVVALAILTLRVRRQAR